MLRKICSLLIGMWIALPINAAGIELRPSAPQLYKVQRGDTLWSVATKFLYKPWQWPLLMQINPKFASSYLLYPGDELQLLRPPSSNPLLKLKPGIHGGIAIPLPILPLTELSMLLHNKRVLSASVVSKCAYIVGIEGGHLLGTVGEHFYARRLHAVSGQYWLVVRPSHVFRAYRSRVVVAHKVDSNVALVDPPWQEIFRNDSHIGHGVNLGIEVRIIGRAQVLQGGDPARLRLTNATREIRPGDRLLPLEDKVYNPYYYPYRPENLPVNSQVIASMSTVGAAGTFQVVTLSIGSKQGASPGQVYALFQPGERIRDDVEGYSSRHNFAPKTNLPNEYVGQVLVFRVFDEVSYGLIMDSIKPVHSGDRLQLPH